MKGRWFVPSDIISLNLNRVFNSILDRVGVHSVNFSWGGRREKRENFPVVAVA